MPQALARGPSRFRATKSVRCEPKIARTNPQLELGRALFQSKFSDVEWRAIRRVRFACDESDIDCKHTDSSRRGSDRARGRSRSAAGRYQRCVARWRAWHCVLPVAGFECFKRLVVTSTRTLGGRAALDFTKIQRFRNPRAIECG